MKNKPTKHTHYYKITNAKTLRSLIPQMDALVLSGDELFGRSTEKVESGIICQSLAGIAEIIPLKEIYQGMIDDLAKVKPATPESLLPTRGWMVRDLKSDRETQWTDVDDIESPEVVKDTVLTGIGRGNVASLISAGGVGKSFLTLQSLMKISCGLPSVFSRKKIERKVVYISLEDCLVDIENRTKRIFPWLVKATAEQGVNKNETKANLKKNFFACSSSVLLADAKGNPNEDSLLSVVSGLSNIDLIVLDTARRSHDLNENDSGQMSMYVRLLEAIAKELNCACLLLHHSSKQGTLSKAQGVDTGATVARGSGALVDNGRGTWVMCKLPAAVAEEHGITEDDRGNYVMIEHEKCNQDQSHPRTILKRIEGGLLDNVADSDLIKKESPDEVFPKKKRGGNIKR